MRQGFQTVASTDEQAAVGQKTCCCRQCRRRGQRQSTRAGNHQQRHHNPQCRLKTTCPPPIPHGQRCQHQQQRHKHRCITVCQQCYLWLLRHRTVQQTHDARQAGVLPHCCGLHTHRAAHIQSTGLYALSRLFQNRDGLPSQQGLIDFSAATDHATIHRKHLTRSHQHHIPLFQMRHQAFLAILCRIMWQNMAKHGNQFA